jgi:uncharacterized membrane protein YdbT with pleckstrin-like domain
MYDFVKALLLPLLRVEEAKPEPLPGHEGELLQIIRACPEYLRYKLFFWKLYTTLWGLAVVIVSTVLIVMDTRFVLLVVPLLVFAVSKSAIFYVATRLDYEMRWYVITELSLLIRQGAWIVREICLTFVNAQNVQATQGPVQRVFGFSNVVVDTAGGGSKGGEEGAQMHRAVLRGLSNPDEVRDLILGLLKRHRSVGLGDPDDQPESSVQESISTESLNEIWQETKQLRAVIQHEVDES